MFRILETLFTIIVVFLTVSEFIIPLWTKQPLFPLIRRTISGE